MDLATSPQYDLTRYMRLRSKPEFAKTTKCNDPVNCPLCGKCYAKETSLRKHLSACHKNFLLFRSRITRIHDNNSFVQDKFYVAMAHTIADVTREGLTKISYIPDLLKRYEIYENTLRKTKNDRQAFEVAKTAIFVKQENLDASNVNENVSQPSKNAKFTKCDTVMDETVELLAQSNKESSKNDGGYVDIEETEATVTLPSPSSSQLSSEVVIKKGAKSSDLEVVHTFTSSNEYQPLYRYHWPLDKDEDEAAVKEDIELKEEPLFEILESLEDTSSIVESNRTEEIAYLKRKNNHCNNGVLKTTSLNHHHDRTFSDGSEMNLETKKRKLNEEHESRRVQIGKTKHKEVQETMKNKCIAGQYLIDMGLKAEQYRYLANFLSIICRNQINPLGKTHHSIKNFNDIIIANYKAINHNLSLSFSELSPFTLQPRKHALALNKGTAAYDATRQIIMSTCIVDGEAQESLISADRILKQGSIGCLDHLTKACTNFIDHKDIVILCTGGDGCYADEKTGMITKIKSNDLYDPRLLHLQDMSQLIKCLLERNLPDFIKTTLAESSFISNCFSTRTKLAQHFYDHNINNTTGNVFTPMYGIDESRYILSCTEHINSILRNIPILREKLPEILINPGLNDLHGKAIKIYNIINDQKFIGRLLLSDVIFNQFAFLSNRAEKDFNIFSQLECLIIYLKERVMKPYILLFLKTGNLLYSYRYKKKDYTINEFFSMNFSFKEELLNEFNVWADLMRNKFQSFIVIPEAFKRLTRFFHRTTPLDGKREEFIWCFNFLNLNFKICGDLCKGYSECFCVCLEINKFSKHFNEKTINIKNDPDINYTKVLGSYFSDVEIIDLNIVNICRVIEVALLMKPNGLSIERVNSMIANIVGAKHVEQNNNPDGSIDMVNPIVCSKFNCNMEKIDSVKAQMFLGEKFNALIHKERPRKTNVKIDESKTVKIEQQKLPVGYTKSKYNEKKKQSLKVRKKPRLKIEKKKAERIIDYSNPVEDKYDKSLNKIIKKMENKREENAVPQSNDVPNDNGKTDLTDLEAKCRKDISDRNNRMNEGETAVGSPILKFSVTAQNKEKCMKNEQERNKRKTKSELSGLNQEKMKDDPIDDHKDFSNIDSILHENKTEKEISVIEEMAKENNIISKSHTNLTDKHTLLHIDPKVKEYEINLNEQIVKENMLSNIAHSPKLIENGSILKEGEIDHSSKEGGESPDDIYCECKMPYSEYITKDEEYRSKMVQCEFGEDCNSFKFQMKTVNKPGGNWFHFDCVGFEVKRSNKRQAYFFCKKCDASKFIPGKTLNSYLIEDGHYKEPIWTKYIGNINDLIYIIICQHEERSRNSNLIDKIKCKIKDKSESLCNSEYIPSQSEKYAHEKIMYLLKNNDIHNVVEKNGYILDYLQRKNLDDFNMVVLYIYSVVANKDIYLLESLEDKKTFMWSSILKETHSKSCLSFIKEKKKTVKEKDEYNEARNRFIIIRHKKGLPIDGQKYENVKCYHGASYKKILR